MKIGGNAIWGEWFNGLIDEVRVYNRALTSAQIQSDMNRSVSVDNTPPSVIARTPAASAVDVDAAPTVTATFNEPMNPATISASTFSVRDSARRTSAGERDLRHAEPHRDSDLDDCIAVRHDLFSHARRKHRRLRSQRAGFRPHLVILD